MEGPSLVIACEEFSPFLKKRILKATGTAEIPFEKIRNSHLRRATSWGKHLILEFQSITLRIHFLIFGSYRIDNPRENRIPKMLLEYGDQHIFFYSCAIKELASDWRSDYDWSVDLMSRDWDAKSALRTLREKPREQVGDLLMMGQKIFAGLGNIMKNEILFRRLLHPETAFGALNAKEQRSLVKEADDYAWQFYEWKKSNVLKRNWEIMRKKTCPRCSNVGVTSVIAVR